jgi:hypothetical protein
MPRGFYSTAKPLMFASGDICRIRRKNGEWYIIRNGEWFEARRSGELPVVIVGDMRGIVASPSGFEVWV